MSPERGGYPKRTAALCFAVQAQMPFTTAGRCAGLSAACENAFVHVLAAAGPVIWTARYHGVYKRCLHILCLQDAQQSAPYGALRRWRSRLALSARVRSAFANGAAERKSMDA